MNKIMKAMLKASFILIGAILFIVIFMGVFNICPPEGPWLSPPWCGYEIKEGINTTAVFFLSVPYLPDTSSGNSSENSSYDGLASDNIPVYNSLSYNSISDSINKVSLSIEGRDPVEMSAIGKLSYQATVEVTGQETLKYRYFSDFGVSDYFNVKIRDKEQHMFDGISGWSNMPFEPDFPKDFSFGMMMFDTWGKNYNFRMFENTRDNIDSSFTRLKRLNMRQVVVTDMFRAVYPHGEGENYESMDYTIEDAIFSDDFRDESLTQKDMNKLAESAHNNNMKLIVETGISLIDYGAYIGSDNIRAEWDQDLERQARSKSKEWVADFFDKKEKKLIELARMLDKAGADEIIINQRNEIPTKPFDEYSNKRLKQLIRKIKGSTGLSVGVFVKEYEALNSEWNDKYSFFKDADDIYLIVESIDKRYNPHKNMSLDEMKSGFSLLLDDYEKWAEENKVRVKIYLGVSSFKDSLLSGYIEFNDMKNPLVKNMVPDWQYQADSYEAFLQSAEGRDFIKGIMFMGYWWDDAMDPESADTRISISFSNRNKNSEAVMMKWGNALK